MDYLVPSNDTVAATAHRRMQINYIRYHAAHLEGKGFGQAMRDLNNGQLIDHKNKTDDQLIDDHAVALFGTRNGQLNTDDSFTTGWGGELQRRATDNKLVIPLPPEGELRDTLMFSVPQPMNIETMQPDWFPTEE